jgi:hypothetical protein
LHSSIDWQVPVGERLGMRWMRWAVDQPPLLAALMPVALTLGMLFVLALFPELRILDFSRGYRGVWPGDGWASTGAAAAILMAIFYLPVAVSPWYASSAYQWFAGLTALAAGLYFMGMEIRAMIFEPDGPATYTLPQFLSPTHLWHLIVIVMMMYLLFALVIPTLVHAHGPWWLWLVKGGIVACGYQWFQNAIVYDNTRPRPNLGDVHPLNGGWFGGLGLQLWHRLFG